MLKILHNKPAFWITKKLTLLLHTEWVAGKIQLVSHRHTALMKHNNNISHLI